MNKKFKHMETCSEESNVEKVSYLQPEILSTDFMLSLLYKLGATSLSLNSLEKKEIVKIFCKHLTPKPQRIYNDKRYSKILLKNQKRLQIKDDSLNQNNEYNLMQTRVTNEWKMSKHKRIVAPSESVKNKKIKPNVEPLIAMPDSGKRSCSDAESLSKRAKITHITETSSKNKVNEESESPEKKKRKIISWP